jgi:nitrile hydratase accessory protein
MTSDPIVTDPVFAEPWEAEAFAMAVALHERGVFTWPEFAEELSRQIAADSGGAISYYHHWLVALEAIIVEADISSAAELDERTEAWHDAAEHTPHGKPILLFGTRER